MKKITLSFLWLVAVFMAAIPAYGAVTQQEALVKVKNLFSGQDADYFLMKDYKTGYWTFFVDPTPLQGWEHDCYASGNVGDSMDVTLRSNPDNSKLTVSSALEGTTVLSTAVNSEDSSVTIDTSSLRPGLYIVSYSIDNNIVDSRKFTKE